MYSINYKPTKDNLLGDAAAIEYAANGSLPAWIALGQVEKYEEAMAHVRKLRTAAEITGLRARRDYLGMTSK